MRTRRWTLAISVALAIPCFEIVACSDDEAPLPARADGGNLADVSVGCGDGCTADARPPDGGGTPDASDGGITRPRGTISISQSITRPADAAADAADAETIATGASAQFTTGGGTPCSATVVDGDCEFISCTIFGAT